MATVTYVNNDYEVLAQAMQQLVTMGYFDSVEYDSENDAVVCKDADENAVLTLAKNSTNSYITDVSFRLDSGTVKTHALSWRPTQSGAAGMIGYIWICSNGAYISASTVSNTSGYAFIIISKTNNDKVGVLFSYNSSSYTAATHRLVIKSWATDDDSVQADNAFTIGTPTIRNQETLFNIPTSASLNHAPSYFPDVYAEFTSQYSYTDNTGTPPVSAAVDGKNYLWVGYYMLADEEEE